MREDLIELATQQAAEIARAGHNGWGNTMLALAVALESSHADAERWRAMRQTLVAADFAPEMGGGPVVMFACHAERVGFGPEGADAIADAAVAAMNGANA